MEQTLGKRIAACRKGLGLTQDALAEQLGVTAQAVSKWENDQSCPDISMLPRLAEIFGVTTDALLGIEKKEIREAELIREEEEDGSPEENGINWEFNLGNSRRGHLGMALWVLMTGGLLLASNFYGWGADLWDILWPSGLLVFGLFGVLPRPSFFRIGCLLFGGYYLLNNLGFAPFPLGKRLLLPTVLLLFGLSLLVDTIKKPSHQHFHIIRSGKAGAPSRKSYCRAEGESFACATSFGENTRSIQLPRLSSGLAEVSFGQLRVDLTGCGEIAERCRIELKCAFGELEVLVPREYRVEPCITTAFASVDIEGEPDTAACRILNLDGSASFGEISIKYI